MQRYVTIFLILIFYIIFFSCEPVDLGFDVNCAECYTSKPDSADIIVQLTFNELNDSIPLTFYRGKIEDGDEEYADTATVENYPDGKYYLLSPVGEYYSIKAVYRTKSGKTVTAVDGSKMRTRHITDACDKDCYIIKGGKLDVRLKYE